MWNAGVAIGTIAMAVATFVSIYSSKKERDTQLNREIIDKIYNSLIKDLRKIKISIEYFKSPSYSPWNWENLKEERAILVYKLPREIFDNIENFTSKFRRYQNLCKQIEVKLIELVEREEKKKVCQLGSKGVWSVCFQGKVGGKFCEVTLFQLLFWNETFDQYIDRFIKENPNLPNRKAEGEFVVLNTPTKLSKEDFEEINASIKKAVNEDSELHQLLNKSKDVYQNAEIIEKKLDIIAKDLSKKI